MTKAGTPISKARHTPDKGRVVIVGAGLAGLFTALKLAPLSVTVIAGAQFGKGASSFWAQAGIAAALAEGDSPEAHAADTIRAGDGLVDETIALTMVQEAAERIEDLLRYGVPFDKDLEGRLALAHEAAHGARRILHIKGDTAGRAIMGALVEAARKSPSITVLEGWTACDLVLRDGVLAGVELAPVGGGPGGPTRVLEAVGVVLATGGCGQLYAVTTNPKEARGEGIAIAARAGAVIADAEFVQFHPTAIDIGRDPAPLATEALRGEGAILIDGHGERFLRAVHPDAELGPRDVVARAVHGEVTSGRGVYLDCRMLGAELEETFPTVFATCLAAGIDPRIEPIPVAPAAHYHMGGVLTDGRGRSTIDHLWACGEVTSTGAHGANRLASNSLLEAVVFGARIAEDIAETLPEMGGDETPTLGSLAPPDAAEELEASPALQKLRFTMTAEVGVIRDAASLASALRTIGALEQETKGDRQLANMLTTAKLIAAAAYARKESRGAHFRSDYPEAKTELASRRLLTLAEAEIIAGEAASHRTPPERAALQA